MRTCLIPALTAPALIATLVLAEEPPETIDEVLAGHSTHGESFDVGPRQKPSRMEGIGRSHLPITTSVPEVQEWFDQGNTLLHNFWFYEAERSFRWALKLDPECAMAWWGLHRSVGRSSNNERGRDFLEEAVARKHTVTARERMYIEAWERAYLPENFGEFERGGRERLAEGLEKIVLAYPNDIEAKSLLVLHSLYGSGRYAREAIIREILTVAPEHPGAHHYRIHNWDGEEGAVALESCASYGRIAWNSGHANHMPGHIYSGIGLWHEAAIWMDSATRVEKAYMERQMTLPFHNWNYAHNRNYLSFIQEQLGMPSLSIDGARQLLVAPLDPKYNKRDGWGVHNEGLSNLIRCLVKFERWDEILDDETIPWRDGDQDKHRRAYVEALAHLAKGDLDEVVARQKILHEGDGRGRQDMVDEIDGRTAIERGDVLEGLLLLSQAAERQWESYERRNDPPRDGHVLYTTLGELYLEQGSPGLAVECFERTLERVHNDGFALSGLARARHALGDLTGAEDAYGRLLAVWSDAEPGLRWMTDAQALGMETTPIEDETRPQRRYAQQTLDQFGPQQWRPYAAPKLDAVDAEGTRVTLEEYRGKNVLLVFYLGEGCVHCVEQLDEIEKKAKKFAARDVELLAICSTPAEEQAASEVLEELPFRLLADPDHENARRFHSYDDFEEIELHSTILIDDEGRIRWARSGGDPFTDMTFLLAEIDRVNEDADLVGDEGDLTASRP